MFVENAPSIKYLKKFYSQPYFCGDVRREGYFDYIGDKKITTRNSLKRLKEIERYKQAGTLLDVGCAAGFFVETAVKHRWEAYGVELSEFASEFARNTLGLNVFNGTFLESNFPAGYFDVITMWDMIEHTPNPVENLCKAFKLLKKDGLLILTTPNFNSLVAQWLGKRWYFYQPPQHLFYFNKTTIRFALQKAGFRIVEMKTEGKNYSLAHVFHVFLGSLNNRKLNFLWNLLGVNHKFLLPKVQIYLNLKDVLKIYCRKP
jgi:SAM-dependent methyltransferase